MRLAVIVGILVAFHISPLRPYQVENGNCKRLHPHLPSIDVSFEFLNIQTWYIYAHTNPSPDYMSIFHLPAGTVPSPHCLRLYSETNRGLIDLQYRCGAKQGVLRMALYSVSAARRAYRQEHWRQLIYKKYRPFGEVQVLATDCDRYVVFYSCQQMRGRALIGLLFLVRTDVYDRFVPPAQLMEALGQNFRFNVTPSSSEQTLEDVEDCDCKAAVVASHAELMQIYVRERKLVKLRARAREQFAIGLRNFFICLLAFALGLLSVGKLIDAYVFEMEY